MPSSSIFLQIEAGAHGGAFGNNPTPAPTDAQCKAGNYKLGRVTLHGMDIAIEQPRGTYRTGIGSDGRRWSSRMAAHYGYFERVYLSKPGSPNKLPKSAVADANGFGNFSDTVATFKHGANGRDVVTILVPGILARNLASQEKLPNSGFRNPDHPSYLGNSNPVRGKILGLTGIPSDSVDGRFFNAILDEAVGYCLSAYAEIFGNSGYGQSILSHGFDSLEVEIKSIVKRSMFRGAHDREVFNSIVKLVSIDVVDMLNLVKPSANGCLDNGPMLFDGPSTLAMFDDPIFVGRFANAIASNLPLAFALWVAEKVDALGDSVGIPMKAGPAKRAINYEHFKSNHEKLNSHFSPKGADGDEVDCFIGFYPQSELAFVINQNVAGRFDEHKIMLCFPDEESAQRAYTDSYERGWLGLASIVPASISQLKWWLKNGNMTRPLKPEHLPHEGLEAMTRRTQWNADALPYDQTLDQVLYDIRRSDAGENLMLDSVSMADILEDSEGAYILDAMVVPMAGLERKMNALQRVMDRAAQTVKPVSMETEQLSIGGKANVTALFRLSDGQTIVIYFHNPDATPKKIAPTDDLISYKWLLNKRDITIVVAPEHGEDLNVNEVAKRIMKLAEKNSAAFVRANGKRAERMQNLANLTTEIAGLEVDLKAAQNDLEAAKIEAEDRAAAPVAAPVPTLEPAPAPTYEFTDATDAFKQAATGGGSDFATAEKMDAKAKELGLKVSWSVGKALLDSATGEPDDDDDDDGEDDDFDAEDDDAEGDDFDAEQEWDAAPELDSCGDEVPKPILDGDFKGHPFRGNQFKKVGHSSRAAVGSTLQAKTIERKGGTKKALKAAHKEAYYSHRAAAVSASGKTKRYHKKMAKFHAGRSGVEVLDSAAILDAAAGPQGLIGKVKNGVKIIGRISIGGDGKAMIFTGNAGKERVKTDEGKPAVWSDDDAPALLDYLTASLPPPAAASGAMPIAKRNKLIDDFQNRQDSFSDGEKAIRKIFSEMYMAKQEGGDISAVVATGFAKAKDLLNSGQVTQERYDAFAALYSETSGVPVPAPTPTPTEDPQMTQDRALFQSVIDGIVTTPDGEGILSATLADTLEAAYMRHAGNADMDALFEKAINAYTDAEVAASANL